LGNTGNEVLNTVFPFTSSSMSGNAAKVGAPGTRGGGRQWCATSSVLTYLEVGVVAAQDTGGMDRIVVGIDGSDTSRRALRWAAEEARQHDAELHVVHAWEVPAPGAAVGLAPRRVTAAADGQRDVAETLLKDVIREELGDNPPEKVRPSIGRGPAATILLEAARGADLLVVGSRGLGGFAGLLLGSVSSKVAHYAACPVVIVRPPAAVDQSEDSSQLHSVEDQPR